IGRANGRIRNVYYRRWVEKEFHCITAGTIPIGHIKPDQGIVSEGGHLEWTAGTPQVGGPRECTGVEFDHLADASSLVRSQIDGHRWSNGDRSGHGPAATTCGGHRKGVVARYRGYGDGLSGFSRGPEVGATGVTGIEDQR